MVMEDLGATAFACTPSYALYLAESIQEAGLTDRLKIRAGIHGAEPWTAFHPITRSAFVDPAFPLPDFLISI